MAELFTPNKTLQKILDDNGWVIDGTSEENGSIMVDLSNGAMIADPVFTMTVALDSKGGKLNQKFAAGIQKVAENINVYNLASDLSTYRHEGDPTAADEDIRDAQMVFDVLAKTSREMKEAVERAGSKDTLAPIIAKMPRNGEGWITDGIGVLTKDRGNADVVAEFLSDATGVHMSVSKDGDYYAIRPGSGTGANMENEHEQKRKKGLRLN